MREIGLGLIVLGLALVVAGGGLWLAARYGFPLGRLPGDIHVEGRRWSLLVPITTMIIVSIVLTILLNLFLRR